MERSLAPVVQSDNEESVAGNASGELERCRQRLSQLEQRETRLVELLGCASPDQIEHKLRNLIHEVQLMRALTEGSESAD